MTNLTHSVVAPSISIGHGSVIRIDCAVADERTAAVIRASDAVVYVKAEGQALVIAAVVPGLFAQVILYDQRRADEGDALSPSMVSAGLVPVTFLVTKHAKRPGGRLIASRMAYPGAAFRGVLQEHIERTRRTTEDTFEQDAAEVAAAMTADVTAFLTTCTASVVLRAEVQPASTIH
jgi:hypothetical protein